LPGRAAFFIGPSPVPAASNRLAQIGYKTFMRIAFLLFVISPALARAQNLPPVDAPRPIPARQSLWTEELTWMEVRDAIRAGNTRILIGTGGIEQNGPYLATGKHNYVLQTVLPYIARAIGRTLIAPIVKFVPEGDIDPKPEGHMVYPGTISVEEATCVRSPGLAHFAHPIWPTWGADILPHPTVGFLAPRREWSLAEPVRATPF